MIANRAIGFAPDDVPGVHAASRELHAGPGRLEVRHYLTEMLRALDRIADFCGLAGVTQRGDSYEQMVARLHGEFGHQIARADKAETDRDRLAALLAEKSAECERLRAIADAATAYATASRLYRTAVDRMAPNHVVSEARYRLNQAESAIERAAAQAESTAVEQCAAAIADATEAALIAECERLRGERDDARAALYVRSLESAEPLRLVVSSLAAATTSPNRDWYAAQVAAALAPPAEGGGE